MYMYLFALISLLNMYKNSHIFQQNMHHIGAIRKNSDPIGEQC